MIPKGRLIIIGGHEEKGEVEKMRASGENLKIHEKKDGASHFEILGTLILKIPRAHHVIEIIAAASSIPKEMEELYIDSYRKVGFTHVGFIKVENEKDAYFPASINRVKSAHAVFFTGGDQEKLIKLITNTPLLAAISRKYYSDKNYIVVGTSAGAMAMPETIIAGGLIREALYKNDIKIAKGFDLIRDVIVDTHFVKRGRFARLAHAVALNPTCLGIGLGEDTALIISDGNSATCIGSGMVILIDASKLGPSNIKKAKGVTPIVIENLVVSIIAEGYCFLLKERILNKGVTT